MDTLNKEKKKIKIKIGADSIKQRAKRIKECGRTVQEVSDLVQVDFKVGDLHRDTDQT